MKLLLVLALVASCSKKEPAPERRTEPPPSPPPAVEVVPKLPGTLWYVDHETLVRVAQGTRMKVGADLYPSRSRIDGQLVAIHSEKNAGETLVLVGDDGATRALGATAAQVRDPAVVGTDIVVAMQLDGVTNLHAVTWKTGATTQLTDDAAGNFEPAALADGAIVFVSSRDGDAELYRRDRDGKVTRLTAFHKDDYTPVPSPDGKTIAFLSVREGPSRIFLVGADGTGLRRLTSGPGEELEVAWSPDGTRVAYVRKEGTTTVVIVRELATGAERIVTPPKTSDTEPAWSPDGTHLAVTRGGAVWVVPVHGGDGVRVGDGRLARWF